LDKVYNTEINQV